MTSEDEFVVIPPDELSKYTDKNVISSHCMIFARVPGVIPPSRNWALVMMQMRFDGKLGFAGGLTEINESPVEAVNREMQEEINLDLTCHRVEPKHHIISHYNKIKDSVHHFYALEVTDEEFRTIEQRSLEADYRHEVLGILRVPLYTRRDGVSGFPTFLANQFVSCCCKQMLTALKTTKLLSDKEIEEAEKIASKIRNG